MILGLRTERTNETLHASSTGNFGQDFRSELSPLLVLGDDLDLFLAPVLDGIRLKRPATIKTLLLRLRALGEAFVFLKIASLPRTENDWQKLVLDVHRYVLTRTDRKASLKTRCIADWQMTRSFFVSLIESGVAPISIYLPVVRQVMETLDISPYQEKLLGQRAPVVVSGAGPIDKLICSVSVARTDADYLEEIRDTLALRRNILKVSLTDYWNVLKANLEYGEGLRGSVNWDELATCIEGLRTQKEKDDLVNPIHGRNQLANYLAIIENNFDGCPPSDDQLRNKLGGVHNWPLVPSSSVVSSWALRNDAPPGFYEKTGWSHRTALWWWQGRISQFDVAMLTALLIMLQPSWTPGSVIQAKISNRHGKSYLDFSDEGHSYEVEKPRAKAMKEETLDPIAHEIISTLVALNRELRADLLAKKDAKASLLFLPYGKTRVSLPNPTFATAYLSGSGKRPTRIQSPRFPDYMWIGTLFPHLVDAGLTKGTISFKKIRNTEGVLEWFRTKSLRAVSKKLGNTERVVLQHYIPKALMESWNTRVIRRFQNLLIVIAAADKDFLLEVSDFANLADLHSFLVDMLQLHGPNDAPLAGILHRRFGHSLDNEIQMNCDDHSNSDSHLHVAISTGSLSALYSYQAAVLSSGIHPEMLDRVDVVTGLSPRHFLDLTDLLQVRLPAEKNPQFLACHEAALVVAASKTNQKKWAKVFEC